MKPETRPRPSGPSPQGERVTGTQPARPTAATPAAASSSAQSPAPPAPKEPYFMERETVTLHGRRLSPSEFTTAMVHFHRAEVQRSNTWRNRLDTTTNWAVITAGATLSFAFSSSENPHFVILINTVLIGFFLTMEARRYRYYEIWASRVRVIETGFFAQLLTPTQIGNEAEWADHLSKDLRTPHFTISIWEAVGRRLRRNYLWIFFLLAASWNLKVYLHPKGPAANLQEFIHRAAIGVLPGDLVLLGGVFFNVGIVVFALATIRLKQATGEVLPTHEFHPFRSVSTTVSRVTQTRRTTTRRTKKARERTRTLRTGTPANQTGEWKRLDTTDLPEREEIHRTDIPAKEETFK